MIWPEIMGTESSFSTKIAYAKTVKRKGKHNYRHIYSADYDGSYPIPLIDTPTVNVAPRWNYDLNKPLIFYSESARTNISLRIATMDGKRKIASNFDGLNMLPAFSKNGKKVTYCISGGNGKCDLYYYENKKLKKLLNNTGNNISPTLSDDGNRIFFCSDFKNKTPLIYCFNRMTNKITQITNHGPCFSPTNFEKNGDLAYVKRVNGVMQIFVYNEKTEKHRQLTDDINFHKEECMWSPCGNYLIFSLTSGSSSRLAIEHITTKKRHIVTSLNNKCNYPAWSPRYHVFPEIGKTI